MFPPPGVVWEGMVELSKLELCGGGKHRPTKNTTKCSECEKNNGKPTWKGSRVKFEPEPPPFGWSGNEIECRPPGREIGPEVNAGNAPEGMYPCSSPKKNKNNPCTVTCYEKINDECYRTKWVLKSCSYKGEEEDVKEQDTSKEAVPYILEADWEKNTKYTVIVSKNTSDKLPLGQYKKDGESFGTSTILGDRTWTVAQAEIYNPTKADMFNQDWHVRLKSCKIDDLNVSFFSVKVSNILPSSIKKVLDKGIGQALVH